MTKRPWWHKILDVIESPYVLGSVVIVFLILLWLVLERIY